MANENMSPGFHHRITLRRIWHDMLRGMHCCHMPSDFEKGFPSPTWTRGC